MDATRRSTLRTLGRFSTIALLGMVSSGCAATVTRFEPVRSSGAGTTYATKSYELKVGPSPVGEAVVWSEGVAEGSARDVVDVEMVISNATRRPIGLDIGASKITVMTHGGRVALGKPLRVGGSRQVMPDSSERIGLRYALPSDLRATDLSAFDFEWSINSPAGDVVQRTSFVPYEPPSGTATMYDALDSCSGVNRPRSISDCIGPPPSSYVRR